MISLDVNNCLRDSIRENLISSKLFELIRAFVLTGKRILLKGSVLWKEVLEEAL